MMRKKPPPVVWVAVVALIMITAIQMPIGLAHGKIALLIAVPLNLILAYGLYAGHKWAYVLTLLTGLAIPLVLCVAAPQKWFGVLVVNAVVYVPVLVATRYYWPEAQGEQPNPLVCPSCGYSLLGLTTPRCPECGTEFEGVSP